VPGIVALVAVLRLTAAPAGVSVPFTWTPGQIEIAVDVNGTPATFLLDTGSEYSVVSTRLAKLLGIVTTARGARDFADGVRLTIGPVALENQRVMVMPFDTYYDRGRHIDGLIGYDFFATHTAAIDFTDRRLTVWTPDAFRAPAAAIVVPITFSGRLPVVAATLTLPGRAPLAARLLIDTGASQSIMLRNPYARANGLLEGGGRESSAPSLASGRQRTIEIDAEGLAVGTLMFDRPRAQAFVDSGGSAGSTETDGLIGNTLLSRFVLYVDYARNRLLFEPVARR
jgi:predicted aspartyl protease